MVSRLRIYILVFRAITYCSRAGKNNRGGASRGRVEENPLPSEFTLSLGVHTE